MLARTAVPSPRSGPAEPREQRVGAEPAVPHPDAVLGRQVGGDAARGPAGDREALHRHAVRCCRARSAAASRPAPCARPAASRSSSARSCAGPGPVQHRRERPAGLGERGGAEDVRGARLVPVRRGRPASVPSRSTSRDGAAARQVRGGGVEPVAAPDQRPRAERGVELVPGQRDVVDASRGEVDAAVRGELRGVDAPPGRPPRGRSRRSARSGSTSPVTLDAPVTATQRRRGRRAGRASSAARVSATVRGRGQRPVRRARPPRQQVGVVLDVEAQRRLAGHGGGQQVQRVGGVAGEHHDVVGPGPDELADRARAPLQQRGADLRGVARAAVHARVVAAGRSATCAATASRAGALAARSRLAYSAVAAGDQRDPRSPRRPGGESGRAVETGRSRVSVIAGSFSDTGTRKGPRLPRTLPRRPGRHPEHPTAEEGCRPASRGLALALMTLR